MTFRKGLSHEITYQNQILRLQTGHLAQQATTSVLATIGDTTVLAAVVVGKETNGDFLPLQVVYEERLYASGKIKGSRFVKREGRPSDNAVLTGRMIDRSIRSLLNSFIRSDIQIVITVLSIDGVNPPDTLAVLAASAALGLCKFEPINATIEVQKESLYSGPVSSIRIGLKPSEFVESLLPQFERIIADAKSFEDIQKPLEEISEILNEKEPSQFDSTKAIFTLVGKKNPQWAARFRQLYNKTEKLSPSQIVEKYNLESQFQINPSYDSQKLSLLDLVVSGDGNSITMIEAGAHIVSENVFNDAIDKAMVELATLTQFQIDFITKVTSQNQSLKLASLVTKAPTSQSKEFWVEFTSQLEQILYSATDKTNRNENLEEFKKAKLVAYQAEQPELVDDAKTTLDLPDLERAFDIVVKSIVKNNIIQNDRRLDGRKLNQTRTISAEVGVLPRTHGSSLFERGETQVLNVLTLGTNRDAQIIDEMEDFEEQTKRYIHHYNFPGYSTGEVGRYGSPGRREIGHGALAEKALLPVLPSEEQFPYTMRLVSECLGSNGSTSMASTCASCLSLLDGGVPIRDLVAGAAMGLVLEKDGKYKILTDILGTEDHYGDMDFKVAGTKDGITALQLDNKVAGLTPSILKAALVQAKEARLHILSVMGEELDKPRAEVSQFAPRVMTMSVPTDKIGEVIGPSGKVIKGIIQKFEVEVDIEDITGKVCIYGKDSSKVEEAISYIHRLVKGYQIGDKAMGKVFRVEAYGAFVKLDGGEKEGLIHISELAEQRVAKVEDVVNIGQEVELVVIDVNEKGQLSLSLKRVQKA